jgi:hypothetical protein
VLWRYAGAPGTRSGAPVHWPDGTALRRSGDRLTLTMFVHPHCACSRASVAELGKLVARVRGQVDTQLVFVLPRGVDPDWAQSDLRTRAAHLSDVRLVEDVGGVEARRFGAVTSGATLLYDRAGKLAFAGGITAVRGHEGDSFGQERIVALITSGAADRTDSPVFGCVLDDNSQRKDPP